jgi:hypothetical protein
MPMATVGPVKVNLRTLERRCAELTRQLAEANAHIAKMQQLATPAEHALEQNRLLREALVILQREFDHDLIETNPDCEGCKLVARITAHLSQTGEAGGKVPEPLTHVIVDGPDGADMVVKLRVSLYGPEAVDMLAAERAALAEFGKDYDEMTEAFHLAYGRAGKAESRLKALVEGMRSMKTAKHYECEDLWFSCPKSEEGCANGGQGNDCTCGVDDRNAKIAALLREGEKP